MRLKGDLDGSSVSNIFEDLCTEEVMGSETNIFEADLKISASEAWKKNQQHSFRIL